MSFWGRVDTYGGITGIHLGDCEFMANHRNPQFIGASIDQCDCGAASEWLRARTDNGRCLALNGRGERCNERTGDSFPFCGRYHADYALDATLDHLANLTDYDSATHERRLVRLVNRLIEAFNVSDKGKRRVAVAIAPDLLDADDDNRNQRVTAAPRPPERTALYRHYDADGVLLYVGITNNTEARFKAHAVQAIWPQFAASHTGEWFGSRAEALAAEREAIRTERPLFNKANADADRDDRVKRYLIEREAWEYLLPAA